MINRRHLLGLAGSATVAGLISSTSSSALAENVSTAPEQSGDANSHFSAAQRQTIRNRIIPVSPEELMSRQQRARQLMDAARIDALFIEASTSLKYFTGLSWWPSERLFAMVLPRKSDAFFICPHFEEGRAREKLGDVKLYTWEEHEDPFAALARACKEAKLLTATVGIEEATRYYITEKITQYCPHWRLHNAVAITAGCRSEKSAHEIELMQIANDITALVYTQTQKMLREDMSQSEVGELLTQLFAEFDVHGEALILFGESSAYPHGLSKDVKLRDGHIVLIDGGCTVEGYGSDITRTMIYGQASEKMRSVWHIVRQAQDAALKQARPGVMAESVDAAARKIIADAGYGPGYKYFTHRLGHGIGMDGHEWFYLVGGNKRLLRAHNMFSNEPGIYLPNEFGIRLEDEMLITDDGARLLLPQAQSLEQIF